MEAGDGMRGQMDPLRGLAAGAAGVMLAVHGACGSTTTATVANNRATVAVRVE